MREPLRYLHPDERPQKPNLSLMTTDELIEQVWRGNGDAGYMDTFCAAGMGRQTVRLYPIERRIAFVPERERVRPRCPNKWLQGRKGTRRQWKSMHPPHWRETGRQLPVVRMADRTQLISAAFHDEITRALASTFTRAGQLRPASFGYDVEVTTYRHRLVERFFEIVGGGFSSHLEIEQAKETRSVWVATAEEAHGMLVS